MDFSQAGGTKNKGNFKRVEKNPTPPEKAKRLGEPQVRFS